MAKKQKKAGTERDHTKRTPLQQARGGPGSLYEAPHGPGGSSCFACDGTGERCNGCGETESACGCESGFSAGECDTCGGTGR
jgi:hypothetical protein